MNTQGISLNYKNGDKYEKLPNLTTLPALGGNYTTLDSTTFDDNFLKKERGLKDFGDTMAFGFLYDHAKPDSAYDKLVELEKLTEPTEFRVIFPDGAAFDFSALVNVQIDAAKVNGNITFTAGLFPQSDITKGTANAAETAEQTESETTEE